MQLSQGCHTGSNPVLATRFMKRRNFLQLLGLGSVGVLLGFTTATPQAYYKGGMYLNPRSYVVKNI